MKRNNCETSRKLNGNWSHQVNLDLMTADTISSTDCFIGDGPKVMKFTDIQMSNSLSILAYSCDGLIGINK